MPPTLPLLFLSVWSLLVQDEDSYGEDEFDRSEGGGGGRKSPGRERGGGGGEFGGGRVPCEASEWPMSKRIKGLQTLKRLSKANRCVYPYACVRNLVQTAGFTRVLHALEVE